MPNLFIPDLKHMAVDKAYIDTNFASKNILFAEIADVTSGSSADFTHNVSIVNADEDSTLTLGGSSTGYGAEIDMICDAANDAADCTIKFTDESAPASYELKYDSSAGTLSMLEKGTDKGLTLASDGGVTMSQDLDVTGASTLAALQIDSLRMEGTANNVALVAGLATNTSTIQFDSGGTGKFELKHTNGGDFHIGPYTTSNGILWWMPVMLLCLILLPLMEVL